MILGEDRRVRFAVCSREGTGQLHLAIPALAWKTMETGLSQEFNLALVGIPLMAALARVRDRETALTLLRNHVLVRERPDVPAARESEILCAVGSWHEQIPMVVILVTERGRKAMQAGRRHDIDLRATGLPLQVHLAAFDNPEGAQEHIMAMVDGNTIVRDVSDQDLTFTPHSGTRH